MMLSSCKKDDDDDSSNGALILPQQLVINGSTYEWGTAYMEYYPDYGVNSSNLDLILLTDGITLKYDADNNPESLSGRGYMLYLEMFSSDSTYISDGVYRHDNTLKANTYYNAFLTFVFNGVAQNTDQLEAGEFEVIYTDNLYTLSGTGTNAENKDFSFTFQGEITRY